MIFLILLGNLRMCIMRVLRGIGPTHIITDSYLYLERHLAKFIMNTKNMSNSRGSVRTQNMSMKNISNHPVCSTDKSESKIVHVDKSKSERIYVLACSMYEQESKSAHKMDTSVNTKKVTDTKYEETLVKDNYNIEVIMAPGYFKLFDCGKMLFNNLDTKY